MKKILIAVIGLIFLVSLAANALTANIFFNFGKASVGSVCGKDIIDKWNSAYSSVEDKTLTKKVISEIEKKDGFENDANCLAIKYFGAEYNADTFNKLKAKVNNNENPSLNIRGIANVDVVRDIGEVKINNLGDAENINEQ